jgi:hypothetical protein
MNFFAKMFDVMMTKMCSLPAEIEERGYAIVPSVLDDSAVNRLLSAVEQAAGSQMLHGRGGIRNLLDRVPAVRSCTESPSIRGLVESTLGVQAFAVRGILFDKTPGGNWKVPWHQDLTIAVQTRIDAHGFGPWTVKEGVCHVQPPAGVLEGMLSVRIHLDDCDEENGPLRVMPGTHRNGRLSAEEIRRLQGTASDVPCLVGRGGVVLMRPLLVHASSAARSPRHRRVVHIDFASSRLPQGLRWHWELQ